MKGSQRDEMDTGSVCHGDQGLMARSHQSPPPSAQQWPFIFLVTLSPFTYLLCHNSLNGGPNFLYVYVWLLY